MLCCPHCTDKLNMCVCGPINQKRMALRTTLKLSASKMQQARIQAVACRGSFQASAFWTDGAATRFNGFAGMRRIHRPSSSSATLSYATYCAQTRSAQGHPSLLGSSRLPSHPPLRPLASRQLHARSSSFKRGVGKCSACSCHQHANGNDAWRPFGHFIKSNSPYHYRTPSRFLATRAAGQVRVQDMFVEALELPIGRDSSAFLGCSCLCLIAQRVHDCVVSW